MKLISYSNTARSQIR